MKKSYLALILLSLIAVLIVAPSHALARGRSVRLYMEDGQIFTRPVRVYIPDSYITKDMNPELYLWGRIEEGKGFRPDEIAPNQEWVESGKGAKEGLQTGTLLLFDLSKEYSMSPLMACSRILPIINWQEPTKIEEGEVVETREMQAVSEKEVVLGNSLGSFIWTFLIVGIFIIIVHFLVKKLPEKKNLASFIKLIGGSFSLSLFQMALWTVAVGFMVILYGLMRLRVPQIPDTLIWLMGLSAGASAAGHFQAHKIQEGLKRKEIEKTGKARGPIEKASLGTMLTLPVEEKDCLSLAKVQLLFWTAITIVLFIVKSYLEGQLWDVPYQLVFLMGISQAGFLARNQMAIHEQKNNSNQVAPAATKEAKQEKGAS
jgi:hypothetical protein